MFRLHRAILIGAGVFWAASVVAGQDASPRAAEVVRTRCTACHAMDLIEQQALTPAAWDREVAKMIGWGATVDSSQAGEVAAYLAAHYGPARPATGLPSDATNPASRLLTTRCTVCHATGLIAAQRLDAEGWRRELAKMVNWGAVLSPDEQTLLVEHLAHGSR
jgi:cytochrome c5